VDVSLRHHGDQELGPGLLDLAVNVRATGPPAWLVERLAASLSGLGAYPDPRAATAAVAARHGRDPSEVLLTAGAAEAFVLLARVLRPRHAVCVHPSFTEPEAALRAAGHDVHRVVLDPPYAVVTVPEEADLVVVGNPTNPTGVLHRDLARLCRPGRTVVVDEARIPILSSCSPRLTPAHAASTRKAVILGFLPSSAGEVRAKTVNTSAKPPFVIQILPPFRT